MNTVNITTNLKSSLSSTTRDVVGIEIGANLPQGAPAVRLHISKKQVELLAAGFIELDQNMPRSTAELEEMSTKLWHLPKAFQASKAAIAITSPHAVLRQTFDTGDQGSAKESFRKVLYSVDDKHPPLVSFMPDYLAAWAATRLPAGHRPTARSIQTSPSAAINCFLGGPVTASSDKPAAVIFCFSHHSAITVFFANRLVLYREHPIGYATIKEALSANMRIDISMAETIMDDPIVDISPVVTPLLETLFRQVEISADYLARKKECVVNNFIVYGLPCGVNHWITSFKQLSNKTLHHLHPFGGITCNTKKLILPEDFEKNAPLFMTAIGAARALLEDL